ncbi:hypothetical protein GGH18_001950, partial [Coemansia sp. RSA 530]
MEQRVSANLEKLLRVFGDTRVQLATTALAASAITAGVMWGTRRTRRSKRARDLKRNTLESIDFEGDSGFLGIDNEPQNTIVTKHTPVELTPNEESLIREQLARHYAFLGTDGMAKLRDSFVVVVGAGGVGSWAAMMLLRSG